MVFLLRLSAFVVIIVWWTRSDEGSTFLFLFQTCVLTEQNSLVVVSIDVFRRLHSSPWKLGGSLDLTPVEVYAKAFCARRQRVSIFLVQSTGLQRMRPLSKSRSRGTGGGLCRGMTCGW